MRPATMQLIEAVERLNMTGEIGDGMVARLHELAALARLEKNPVDAAIAYAARHGRSVANAIEIHRHCDELVQLDEAALAGLRAVTVDEDDLRKSRNAMDASTLGGRERTERALQRLNEARQAQPHVVVDGGRCRHCGCPR